MSYNGELFGLDYDIPTGELIDKYRENMVGICLGYALDCTYLR